MAENFVSISRWWASHGTLDESKIRKNYKIEVLINNSSQRNQFSTKALFVGESKKHEKTILQICARNVFGLRLLRGSFERSITSQYYYFILFHSFVLLTSALQYLKPPGGYLTSIVLFADFDPCFYDSLNCWCSNKSDRSRLFSDFK